MDLTYDLEFSGISKTLILMSIFQSTEIKFDKHVLFPYSCTYIKISPK